MGLAPLETIVAVIDSEESLSVIEPLWHQQVSELSNKITFFDSVEAARIYIEERLEAL